MTEEEAGESLLQDNAVLGSNRSQVDRGADEAEKPAPYRQPLQANQLRPALLPLIKKNIHILAGHVHFVGLREVADRLGPKWPAMAERANEIACRAIERRLAQEDIYVRATDHQYLMILANSDEREAKLKCALIADEIKRLLIGEDNEIVGVTVKTEIGAAREGGMFEDVPDLQELLASASAPQRQSARASMEALSKVNVDDPAYILQDVHLAYRPTWHVRQNALSVFHCVPALVYPGGAVMFGEAAIPRGDEPDVAFELDLRCLNKVIEDQRRLTAEGRRVLLSVPVHFETMAASARRGEYARLCKLIPPLANRLTVFELVQAPEGVPPSRLLEIASSLRAVSRAVLLRVPLATTAFYPFGHTGVIGVSAVVDVPTGSERKVMTGIERFANLTNKMGLQTVVHGLRSISLTSAAVAAGIHYIGGDALTSVVDLPRDIRAFNPRDLYSRFLPKAPRSAAPSG